MSLVADECYRALAARDARFDGRFFTAVQTTGIYCRPICPARTPRRHNVRFFACAAAAEAAGFRACMRCRPNASPGSATWMGTSAVVARAMRLLSEGALDDGDVDGLAERLGIGARHLRRLFVRHLGACPRAIAQTRRAHFARQLLDETSLPMTEIAYAAGYASVRRFNSAFRRSFGASPSAMRRASAGRSRDRLAPRSEGEGLELGLVTRAPFDWASMLSYLGARQATSVECVDGSTWWRNIELDGQPVTLEIRAPRPGASESVRVIPVVVHGPVLARTLVLVERVRRMLDLDADPDVIAGHLALDATLARRVAKLPGVRIAGAWHGFEIAVRALLGQQVSVTAAATHVERLVQRCGAERHIGQGCGPVGAAPGALSRLFPTPASVAALPARALAMPEARARALVMLSREVRDGHIALDGSDDPSELRAKLCAMPGIGPWTAEYVALRAGRDPDALPSSDLGLRRALASHGERLSAREVEARAEAWRPFRGYAAMLLWQTEADDVG